MGKETNIKDTIDELNKKNIELSNLTEELKEERDRLHNALEELSEAKEFYRIMGEALPYGIWMCDAEGKAKYMSQSFLDLLEMTLEQAQEFGWAHRLPPEDVDHMFEAWLECVHTGKDWDSEHRILGPDGKYHTVLTRGKPVRDKEGKIISWVGINLDIDQRKEMEAEARQKEIEIAELKAHAYEEERKRAEALTELREAQLDAFFANSPAILNLVDENLCYINTDNITPTYYGLNRESIIGKSVKDLSMDFFETTGRIMQRVIETGEPVLNEPFESPLPDGTGEIAYWRTSFFRVPLGNDEWGVGVISTEITDIKRSEKKLRESEERFRTLADNISQLAWMGDDSGGLFWYNKRWYDYTGTTYDEMQGWGWEKVHHPDHIDRATKNWINALTEGKPWEDTFPLRNKEGEYRWFLSRAVPILDDNGKIFRWFGTNTDITESKKAEEQLTEAYKSVEERLKEKEVLLREIYHRTKNTLQLISSMLSLRGSVVRNSDIHRIIEDTQDRIRAIALVHEKLYNGNNLSRVNLRDYISSLASLLINKHSVGDKIILKYELEEIYLLIDSAIPCGLIITELLMNSVKHAFPGDRKGIIEIKLKRMENQLIELIISDNGIGLNESDQNSDGKLGLQLFRSIAENQLDATVSLNADHGVEWSIRFTDALYEERV